MAKKVLDVPKIKQLPRHCGPASLSMVLSYLGHDISQEEIAEYWGEEHIKKRGVEKHSLVLCARELGFIAHPYYNLRLEDVIRIIDSGLPIIARVQSRTRHGAGGPGSRGGSGQRIRRARPRRTPEVGQRGDDEERTWNTSRR